MTELFKVVYKKFTDSTGASSLYAALNGGLYNTEAPQEATRPYAIFYLVSDVPHWTFDATMENSLLQFTIYDENPSVENIGDLYDKLTSLYDWAKLSSTGNYNPIYMKREFSSLEKSSDIWQYIVEYRTELQEK